MTGRALVVRGDAARLPLPDASVDLICTSPPFFALRSYSDGGKHYDGQLGSEPTPAEYVAALVECTREWCRVLKPDGNLFIELGDKYAAGHGGSSTMRNDGYGANLTKAVWDTSDVDGSGSGYGAGHQSASPKFVIPGTRPKSLLGTPWRYAIACMDELGLILRAEIVWHHVNGLPESVTDRVRRGHSTMFHLVKQPRYYSAIDEIREPHTGGAHSSGNGKSRRWVDSNAGQNHRALDTDPGEYNPLGKLPGSVWHPKSQDDEDPNGPIWDIPSQPLRTPECRLVWDGRTVRWFPTWADGHAHMRRLTHHSWVWAQHRGRPSLRPEVDHFAAWPMEVPRRVILGWSPPGICVVCGEGRRPVADRERVDIRPGYSKTHNGARDGIPQSGGTKWKTKGLTDVTITGYACACTPYTDHPGTGESSGEQYNNRPDQGIGAGRYPNQGANWGGKQNLGARPKVGPWREYHFTGWTPPPTRPALILDPFGGTGSTALTAATLGRDAITVDMSQDYSRLARWRTTDRPEVARAMGVKKPPPVPDGQGDLFALEEL